MCHLDTQSQPASTVAAPRTWGVCPVSQAHSRRAHRETTWMAATGSAPGQGSQEPPCAPSSALGPCVKGARQARDSGKPVPRGATHVPLSYALHIRLTLRAGRTRTLIMYSMRLWECFSITDSIQIKGLTCRGEGTWCSRLVVLQSSLSQRGNRASDHWAWCEPSTAALGRIQAGARMGQNRERMQKASQRTLWGAAGERGQWRKGSDLLKVRSLVLTSRLLGARLPLGHCARPTDHLTDPKLTTEAAAPTQQGRGALPGRGGGGSLGPRRWRLCTHVRVEAVGHELELAVGRDEGDGAVVLKAREPHALVELHVLRLHGLAFATCREWGCEGVTGRPWVPRATLSAMVPLCLTRGPLRALGL